MGCSSSTLIAEGGVAPEEEEEASSASAATAAGASNNIVAVAATATAGVADSTVTAPAENAAAVTTASNNIAKTVVLQQAKEVPPAQDISDGIAPETATPSTHSTLVVITGGKPAPTITEAQTRSGALSSNLLDKKVTVQGKSADEEVSEVVCRADRTVRAVRALQTQILPPGKPGCDGPNCWARSSNVCLSSPRPLPSYHHNQPPYIL